METGSGGEVRPAVQYRTGCQRESRRGEFGIKLTLKFDTCSSFLWRVKTFFYQTGQNPFSILHQYNHRFEISTNPIQIWPWEKTTKLYQIRLCTPFLTPSTVLSKNPKILVNPFLNSNSSPLAYYSVPGSSCCSYWRVSAAVCADRRVEKGVMRLVAARLKRKPRKKLQLQPTLFKATRRWCQMKVVKTVPHLLRRLKRISLIFFWDGKLCEIFLWIIYSFIGIWSQSVVWLKDLQNYNRDFCTAIIVIMHQRFKKKNPDRDPLAKPTAIKMERWRAFWIAEEKIQQNVTLCAIKLWTSGWKSRNIWLLRLRVSIPESF